MNSRIHSCSLCKDQRLSEPMVQIPPLKRETSLSKATVVQIVHGWVQKKALSYSIPRQLNPFHIRTSLHIWHDDFQHEGLLKNSEDHNLQLLPHVEAISVRCTMHTSYIHTFMQSCEPYCLHKLFMNLNLTALRVQFQIMINKFECMCS